MRSPAGASEVRIETMVGEERTKRKQAGEFPPDVLLLIFGRLPTVSLAFCSTVCTAWHDTIKNSPFLWERAFVEGRKEMKLRPKICEYELPKKVEFEIQGASEPTKVDFKTRGVSERQRTHLVQGLMVPCFWQAHKRRVDSCRMSMDTIVSGSSDQTVRVWSASTLRCLEEYKVSGPKSSKMLKPAVVDLDFDENKIIGAVGAEVWVWNRNRGGLVTHKMGGHSNPLYCLCYTEPEVAVGCADGCTRIYDMYSGRCSRIFRNHSEAVTCVSINEETDLLASGSRDGSLQLCDLSSGTNVACLLCEYPMAEVNCLQMGMNGRFLFAGTSVGGLSCWDLRKQRLIWRSNAMRRDLTSLHLQEYAPATFITGSVTGGVQVWDSSSGVMLRELKPASICRSETNPGTSLSPIANGSCSVNSLNVNFSNLIIPKKQSAILCARVSTTRVLTSHADGSLALCTFRI